MSAAPNPFEKLPQLHYHILSKAFLLEEVLNSNINVTLVQTELCEIAAEICRMAETCTQLLPAKGGR